MKLSDLLAPLLDAKVDHELIRQQIVAFERAQSDALEQRRKADAERQQRKRSRDVTLRHSDRPLARATEDKTLTSEIEPQEKVSSGKRPQRLAENWTLPSEWRADALKAGLPESHIDLEADKMRDWSRSAPKGAKTEWRAAWRNWCREAAGRLGNQRAGPPASQPKPPQMADVFKLIKEAENGRQEREDRSGAGTVVSYLPAAGSR